MPRRFQFSLFSLSALLLLGRGFFAGTLWQRWRDMQAFEQTRRLEEEFQRNLKWGLDMALGSDEKKPNGQEPMPRPQFSLKTMFLVTPLVGILFAVPRFATKLYRISLAAAVRARIEGRRKEMEQPSDCGVVNASIQLELRELEATLQKLESTP